MAASDEFRVAADTYVTDPEKASAGLSIACQTALTGAGVDQRPVVVLTAGVTYRLDSRILLPALVSLECV